MGEPLIGRRLLFAGSDPTDETITLQLEVDDARAVRVDISLGLVGPILAAISAEAMKLNAGRSEEQRSLSTTLSANGVWLSQDADDNPMLVFELVNGSLLPLSMKSGDFAGLAREMVLFASNPPGVPH